MFYVLQNESTASLRNIPILLTDAATGTTAMVGVSTASIYPYIAINGGAFIGGTGPVYESGFGQYVYQMHPAETATLGLAGIHITAPACRDYDAIAQIAAFNVYSAAAGGGISAYDVWSFDYSTYPILPVSAAERLEETRTEAYTASNNTVDIGNQVWNRDPLSIGDPTTGDKYSAYLYQLGTGTTGYAGTSITAGDVWSYAGGRTITGGIADTVTLVTSPVDISYPSMAGLANTIWSTDISAYVSPSAGYDLTQAALGGGGVTAGDVWSYATRTITGGIADTVTDVTNGVIVTTNNDKTGYALSSTQTFDLTGNITGNLSGSVGSVTSDVNVSTASMAGVANTVWSTLTAPYTTHATFGHQILRSDNAATIGEVTLHQSGGSKRVDADVHAFVNNTASATAMLNILTGIGSSITGNITGNLSGSVGSVTSDVNVSTASMTGIAGTVWSYGTRTLTSGGGISAYDVWNFDPTAMTSPQAGAILTDIQTDTNSIITDIGNVPNNVWSSDVSGYVTPGEAGYELTQAALGGGGVTAGDVWTYASRTITGGIADTVTTLTDRSGFAITGGTITTVSDKTGYSLSGTQSFNVTGNITGNVSGSVGSVTSAVSLSTATQASIANSVWLTDVTSYAAPSAGEDLATAAVGGISPADVWTYNSRTITGGIADTVTTLTNRAGFAITGGTITTVSDKTGYSLSGSQTFNMTGNITGNVTGSVGSVSGAVGSVAGNVAGNVVGSVASVTNPVSIATASMTGIAGTVWSYGTRTLTSGGGITAGDVWTYNISGITASGSAGNALNDAAVSGSVVTIVNGPYKLNSTAEGTDGRIDILQGSVQTINLNLVNGFGQPFNVTGYTLSVDVYDVSSTLVESYVPTVNFASGGNISFDIDGTVTDVIGTYNLVVSLTDGDVIQVGPITILVRPL